MNIKIYILGLLVFCISWTQAQQVTPSESGAFILKNGTVHTVTKGTMTGDVLIKDGKIADVGANIVAADATEVDCTGKHIYPGMIDGMTRLGLEEIGAVSLTRDFNELGDFNPHMKALTAVNPGSVSIPVTRTNGVTSVIAAPTGGLFSGQASLINLHGYTPQQMYAGFTAVIMNFPSSGKRGRWDRRSAEDIKKDADKAAKKLNGIWDKAQDYARMDSIAQATGAVKEGYNPQMEALLSTAQGNASMMIRVNKKQDILNAIEWVQEREIKAIFVGVAEGWRVAKELAEANIPCVVGPVLGMPTRGYDRYDRPYKNPGVMQQAGVKVAIMTNDSENVRNLPFNAGFAATYGMGKEEALKAVTIVPAEIFGLADQLGSIEAGKVANLFVSDGDPFETKTQITDLFIEGWKVPIESRHTLLYEEFIKRSPGLE